MSQFREELQVIPRAAWIIASIIVVIALIAIGFCLWQNAAFLLFALVPMMVMLPVYVLLVGYVYGDASRRGMRHVMWTLLAIFVPNGIGIILYFVLREPMQRSCPSCGTGCKPGLAYCPNCGAAVVRSCPQCKCPVEESWKNCAHCGVAI